MGKKTKKKERIAAKTGGVTSVESGAEQGIGSEPASPSPSDAGKSNSVEYANIGLMVLALLIATVVPFELFLISYAILGPLHYLTEISWLHDQKFFTPRKTDWVLLAVCALLATLGNGDVVGEAGMRWLDGIAIGQTTLYQFLNAHYMDVLFFAFGAALVFVAARQTVLRLFGLAIVAVCAFLFHVSSPTPMAGFYYKLFGVYLPTLIHVFIFTGAFILAGALKRNSAAGFLSFASFLICGALAIWLPNLAFTPQTTTAAAFWGGFQELSLNGLNDLLQQPTEALMGTNLFTSSFVLRLVRFLAFAYTYHYLNWFSKTSIIGWHTVPRARLAVILVVWFASIGLYAVSYGIGLRWLFLLSLMHVLLEFPLNIKCFSDIGKAVRQRVAPVRAA
ncbi:hypothetical protein [Blastopirellula marina]|uniref:Uncharacterized protein n=1 Tax=Blastopirellula marina TaxID=124 RepID=A0A2S8GDR2_9BACT|nr:hypothetical protein [Blastopirellula marina]PQO42563.1 hypothetical protein C5Y98_01620 [Blastopirellula marina]PTL46329.1 hypothetical protein C5Y97_01620 [Blastopirellula marina]